MTQPPPASSRAKIALCLPGGGLTGALYQIGALAALEDGAPLLAGQGFSLYVGHSSGASVAAALAGGIPISRLYRALLDPADDFFPIERGHVFRVDVDAWRGTLQTFGVALRHLVTRVASRDRPKAPPHLFLWEQADRFNDTLPAGLFNLDKYERFLAQFFLRRGVPNGFRSMPRALRIPSYDLDSGERVIFGSPGWEDVPVSLACSATLALPLFFSPVRIGDRHYLDGGLGTVAHLDVAAAEGAALAVVVNPQVPVATANRAVPTGHGVKDSVRDKGLLWVFNQAMRIGQHARLTQEVDRAKREQKLRVLVLEPDSTDALLFLHNPSDLHARRAILEYAYRTTRERIARWLERHADVVQAMGWA